MSVSKVIVQPSATEGSLQNERAGAAIPREGAAVTQVWERALPENQIWFNRLRAALQAPAGVAALNYRENVDYERLYQICVVPKYPYEGHILGDIRNNFENMWAEGTSTRVMLVFLSPAFLGFSPIIGLGHAAVDSVERVKHAVTEETCSCDSCDRREDELVRTASEATRLELTAIRNGAGWERFRIREEEARIIMHRAHYIMVDTSDGGGTSETG